MWPPPDTEPYVLLDDCEATSAAPTSRLYGGYVRTHACVDPATLDATWTQLEADQQAGLHAVLLVDYEWGARLMGAGHTRWSPEELEGRAPALRVLMFERLKLLGRNEVDAWLAEQDGRQQATPAGAANLHFDLDREGFEANLARIQEALRAGDSYQVNHTLRLDCEVFGSAVALYRRLRAEQAVPYGALLALPDGRHVLSLSPELFLRHDGSAGQRLLTARPMKGTAVRAEGEGVASEAARSLAADPKNRAENVMIVDLLRNDLGRVAEAGSVRVPALFSVETCGKVFQMTSTVEARLRAGTGLSDILRAAFPCGSITGAPKHRTMQIIADLEGSPRGLYCGAIGWVDAPATGEVLGGFCLSVAIRTLVLAGEQTPQGARPARLGVGSGIVLGSDAASEFEEVGLKARFLTELDPGFALFETMLASRETGIRHLNRHLGRLGRSAGQLGFRMDPDFLRRAALEQVARLPVGSSWRLRLALRKDGRFEFSSSALEALVFDPEDPGKVLVTLAEEPVGGDPYLAGHKTDWRPHYDPALRQAVASGCFDQLFCNQTGELVEGTRSNVFLKVQGRWFTPPLSSGALPGIMRGLLLADPDWGATERTLERSDLLAAEQVVLCNALRGPLRARLTGAHPVGGER